MIVITKATYSPIPLKFKILPEKSYTNLGIKFYSISPSQGELFISNNEKKAIKNGNPVSEVELSRHNSQGSIYQNCIMMIRNTRRVILLFFLDYF